MAVCCFFFQNRVSILSLRHNPPNTNLSIVLAVLLIVFFFCVSIFHNKSLIFFIFFLCRKFISQKRCFFLFHIYNFGERRKKNKKKRNTKRKSESENREQKFFSRIPQISRTNHFAAEIYLLNYLKPFHISNNQQYKKKNIMRFFVDIFSIALSDPYSNTKFRKQRKKII